MNLVVSCELEIKKNLTPIFEDFKVGDIILLSGPVGVGKTTFVRNFVEYKSSSEASSPSYNLIQEYPLKDFKVVHIDLYRIKSEEDLESIGFWEVIHQPHCLFFIEWPEKINFKDLPQTQLKTLKISSSSLQKNLRKYKLIL